MNNKFTIPGRVEAQLAVKLKQLGVPQNSNRWYSQWSNSEIFIFHRSYADFSKYYQSKRNYIEDMKVELEPYCAFSLSQLHEFIMAYWKELNLPKPVKNIDGKWLWIQSDYEIDEETEVDATGLYIIKLIEANIIFVKDFFISDSPSD